MEQEESDEGKSNSKLTWEDIKKKFKGPSETARTPFQNMPKLGSAWVKIGSGIRNGFQNLGNGMRNAFSSDNQRRHLGNLGFILIMALILVVIFLYVAKYFWYLLPIVIIIFLFRTEFVRNSPFMQFVLVLGIIILILMFFAPMILNNTAIVNKGSFDQIAKRFAISTANLLDGFNHFNPVENWNGFWDKQVAIATGGYFEGQVEENKDDKRLGIFIENIESSSPILTEGEPVTFWATLKGKTMDNEIQVFMDCNSSNNNEKKDSKGSSFSIYSYEQEDVDCKFSSLKPGSAKITFWADYNFKTLAYNKAYFMDQNRLRALRKQELDPLDEYNIRDKDPIAVYTNGPVHIGIGTTSTQPIPVKNNGDRLAVLGVTLENRWEGKIKKITDLEIQVPKSIELKECDYDFTEIGSDTCVQRCQGVEECEADCSNYWFYQLSQKGLDKLGEVDKYQTFRCGIYAYTSNDILDGSPISTKYFRVIANYDYSAESYKTFYVKKDEY